MTKQEKIEKIKQLLEELETDETIEETPIFPSSAIVYDISRQRYCLKSHSITPGRITPYALACTAAVDILDARWAAVDANGSMLWYKDEPQVYEGIWKGIFCTDPIGDAYMLPCKIDNWKSAKWRIR